MSGAATAPSTRALRALREGDLVAVVAAAGPADAQRVAQVEGLFARHGLRARLYPSCHLRADYLAGSDDDRLSDLHAAFADEDVRAIFSLRGGYGSGRLLDRLDAEHVRRHAKLVVGYSDITALHAWLCHAGLPSLHAPMPASDLVLPGREGDAEALFALLRRGLVAGHVMLPEREPGAAQVGGVAEGRLVGGNLSLVASLVGTPWAWPMRGSILFLEDINEEPYRVDRFLLQLRLSGALDAASGFLIGRFSEQASPERVLEQYLLPLRKPLLAGWPSGHGTPNRALALGVRVRLDAAAGSLELLDDVLAA